MRSLFLFFVCFFVLSCGSLQKKDFNPWIDIANRSEESVVIVKLYGVVDEEVRYLGHGSGSILDESGYILTCAHVTNHVFDKEVDLGEGLVAHDIFAEVELFDRRSFVVLQKWENSTLDVSLIKVEAEGLKPLEFADKSVSDGQFVMTIGSTGPFEWNKSVGIISQVRGSEFTMSASVSPGYSGGPVLDSFGRIVGLTKAYCPSCSDIYLAVEGLTTRQAIRQFNAPGLNI